METALTTEASFCFSHQVSQRLFLPAREEEEEQKASEGGSSVSFETEDHEMGCASSLLGAKAHQT